MARILLTGGLGYIGSHTAVELLSAGHDLTIVDNLHNSSKEVLKGIREISGAEPDFFEIDLSERQAVIDLFNECGLFDGIIHFAAFKAVGESVEKPLEYYSNNLCSLIYLMQEMVKRGMPNLIFSSSCTVYGEPEVLPVTEKTPRQSAISPYGNTKQVGEDIIRDACESHPLQVSALRYFNPIGAHPSALIGELPAGVPQNLVPFVTQTAAGKRDCLSVFGNDYDTRDGTNIRDYIHVVDLARAHVVAMERLLASNDQLGFEVFNLGTGKGSSVLEVIQSFEKVSGQKLNYRIVERRRGDVTAAYADTTKANEVLGWTAQYDLDDAMRDAWRWEKKIRKIEG